MSTTSPVTVTSKTNPLASLKAYIALIGAVASALLSMHVFDFNADISRTLGIVVAVATAIATYLVPNAAVVTPGEVVPGSVSDEPLTGADPGYDDGYDETAPDDPGTPLVPGDEEPDTTDTVAPPRSDLP